MTRVLKDNSNIGSNIPSSPNTQIPISQGLPLNNNGFGQLLKDQSAIYPNGRASWC